MPRILKTLNQSLEEARIIYRCKLAFNTDAHKFTAVLDSCMTRPMVMKP